MMLLFKLMVLFLVVVDGVAAHNTEGTNDRWLGASYGATCASRGQDCSVHPCCSSQSMQLQCISDKCQIGRLQPEESETSHLRESSRTDPWVTYQPGNITTPVFDDWGNEVRLSAGLVGRAIAYTGESVRFADGSHSTINFHERPDGAGIFPKNHENPALDGFYYTSNAEVWGGGGGVYSIEFDQSGAVTNYFQILGGTTYNCGGGATPWGSWISNEEYRDGWAWQTDPAGILNPRKTSLVYAGGFYESFAFDNFQYPNRPLTFYTTEDKWDGSLVRFTPNGAGLACYERDLPEDRWCTLENGSRTYLKLNPNYGGDAGTFEFVVGRRNANPEEYPNAEGIDSRDGILYFVSSEIQALFRLDLDGGTYTRTSTYSGAFDLEPDQLKILPNVNDIIYFCEDGGYDCDVHGRDGTGQYFTILEGTGYDTETTGLNFSPDGRFMFVAFQEPGVIWQIWRSDGFSFHGEVMDIKYHANA